MTNTERRQYILDHVRNSSVEAFTNLRLQTLLLELNDDTTASATTDAADTTALQLLSGANFTYVIVTGSGIYKYASTGTPNGTTIFAASGGGTWNLVFNAGVDTPQLSTPVLTLTVISDTQINATWASVTDAANYQLYRATASDFSDEALVYDGALLLFNSTGLSASTTYYFRLKARGYERMNSAFDSDSAFTSALPVLSTPTGFGETSTTSSSIILDWVDVVNATSYTLERSLTGVGGWSVIYTGSTSGYTDSGLSASTTYFYRVKATASGYTDSAYATDSAATTAASLITANRIAEFMMDEDTGQRLFNTVGGNTSNNNLIWFGEQHWNGLSNYFSSGSYFNKSETTTTENFAANVDGKNQALRVVTLTGNTESGVTGAYAGMRIQGRSFPAGTYTMSLAVKSNTGSAQNMRMLLNGGTISGDLAVTTGWTRVSYTFTHPGGSPLLYFCINGSAGTPMDILIDQLKLETGSSATAYVTPKFDANFGIDGTTEASDPTWVTGKGIAVTSAQNATIFTDTPETITNVSVHVVAKSNASSTDQNTLFSTVFGDGGFELMAGIGGTADTTILAKFKYRNQNALIKLSKFADGETHHFCGTYDGTTLKFYVDSILLASNTVSLSSTSLQRMLLNYTPIVGGTGSNGEIYYSAIYGAAHDQTSVTTQYNALKALMTTRGITMAANTIAIAVEGDSITIDSNTYARKAIRNMVPLVAENFAVVGSTVTGATSLDARKATVKAWLNASTATTKVLSVFIGANDLVSGVPATVLANLKTYCLEMKTDVPGLLIAVCSVLPNTTGSQITNRNVFNPLLVADTSFYDVLVPFHLNAQMGPDAAASDTGKYPDGVHPSNTGHGYLYPDWQTAIETIL